MHHRAKDITGLAVGYLTALKYHGSDGTKSLWLVGCACGVEKVIAATELTKMKSRGVTASCGCMKKVTIGERNTKHGMSFHPAYGVWRGMIDRCRLPSHHAWRNYGARGITVCKRWEQSFDNFWADMGPTYQAGLTLERVRNNRGYSPSNCEWATRKVQANNRRTNVMVQSQWGPMTALEFSERTGLGLTTIYYRLARGVTGKALAERPDVSRRFSTS